MQPRALPDSGSWRLHPLKLPAANLIVWCGGDVCGGGGAHDQLERTPWSEPPARPPWRLYVYKRSGLPYLIVSGVWRNFQFLHICVTFDKFSALNPEGSDQYGTLFFTGPKKIFSVSLRY